MAHAFKKIPAKPAFGVLNHDLYQSDYITNKKSKLAFCDVKYICKNIPRISNYNLYNQYRKGRYLKGLETGAFLPFDTSDLIFGLYSKMDLKNVCTVIDGYPCSNIDSCGGCSLPTTINASPSVTEPFYSINTIDPIGELFGNTSCGTNNFINYMEYYTNIQKS